MSSNKLLRRSATVLSCFLMACQTAPAQRAGEVNATVPSNPDGSAIYAIYLHDIALDRTPEDPERRARLGRVTAKLAGEGINVIAEVRPAGTLQKFPDDQEKYAQKVAGQIGQLLSAGVPPRHVNLIGYSRGAVLALLTATYVNRADVGYVLLAACMSETGAFKQFVPALMRYAEKLNGQFLSVREQSDPDFGSCEPYFAKAKSRPAHVETVLATGKGHQFAMEPDDVWVGPAVKWMKGRQ
jgi:pimeloyl-ACP methyl ester carboxylesterase